MKESEALLEIRKIREEEDKIMRKMSKEERYNYLMERFKINNYYPKKHSKELTVNEETTVYHKSKDSE